MDSERIGTFASGIAAMLVFPFALVNRCVSQAPPTFLQALQQHHISTTRVALVEALRNPNKEVRGLAAAELAEEKVEAALPMIVRAAQEERDPQTRMNLAAAATWMNSSEGLRLLKAMCEDRHLDSWIRLGAARNVFYRQDHSCFPALLEMMQSTEVDARIAALEAASQMRPKTEDESKAVQDLAVAALADPDIRVRLQACDALRWMDEEGSIALLKRAMEREPEETVRSVMASTLAYLVKEHPSP